MIIFSCTKHGSIFTMYYIAPFFYILPFYTNCYYWGESVIASHEPSFSFIYDVQMDFEKWLKFEYETVAE